MARIKLNETINHWQLVCDAWQKYRIKSETNMKVDIQNYGMRHKQRERVDGFWLACSWRGRHNECWQCWMKFKANRSNSLDFSSFMFNVEIENVSPVSRPNGNRMKTAYIFLLFKTNGLYAEKKKMEKNSISMSIQLLRIYGRRFFVCSSNLILETFVYGRSEAI